MARYEPQKKDAPCYEGYSVSSEWKNSFDKFYNWYISQPYYAHKDKFKLNIDKDLLISKNKHYSEETCVLIPRYMNDLIKTFNSDYKGYFLHDDRKNNPWRCKIYYMNSKGKRKKLVDKHFKTKEEARFTYLKYKIRQIEKLQKRFKTQEIDIRVYTAIEACMDNLRKERDSLQETLAKGPKAPIMPV